MAFDMYLENDKEFIDHQEEYIFYLVNEDNDYPKLNWLWENFYDGPRIPPEFSSEIFKELTLLRSSILDAENNKGLISVIDRIVPFFKKAHDLNRVIRCVSD